jgi:hypothetical protein
MNDTQFSLSPSYGQVLVHWYEAEHDGFYLGPRSRLIVIGLLVLIVAWALYTDSPLMAITFILIGVIGYLLEQQTPKDLDFALTTRGVLAGRQFYPYETLQSFHIYEEEPFLDTLSLHTDGDLISHIHIPLVTADQQLVFDTLSGFVPELPHEPNFLDSMEKLMHI